MLSATKPIEISTHIFLPKEDLPPNLDLVRDSLLVHNKFGGASIPVYRETDSAIGFPIYNKLWRQYINPGKKILDKRVTGKPIAPWKFTSTLRPAQQRIFNDFVENVKKGKTGFILNAPAGFGKTVLLLAMLSFLGKKALVVVNKTDLVTQWVERISHSTKGHTNIKKNEIGVITDGKWDDPQGKKIFIGLVHTLNLDRFPKSFSNEFGVVVFDEVDRSVPPETYAPVIDLFPAKYRIGASATLKRQDGLEKILFYHLGGCYLFGSNEGRMSPTVVLHRYHKSSGNIYGKTLLSRRGVLISKLSENDDRNNLIVKYALKLLDSGRRVVIISDRTYQLFQLFNKLIISGVNKVDIAFYTGSIDTGYSKIKVSKQDLKTAIKHGKILLATYGMMKMGTDIPDLAAMIYGTPQTDIVQTKGRIERMCEGKKTPIIIDIIDTKYKETLNWGRKRLQQYNSDNMRVYHGKT